MMAIFPSSSTIYHAVVMEWVAGYSLSISIIEIDIITKAAVYF
jgi:hypothetical protein